MVTSVASCSRPAILTGTCCHSCPTDKCNAANLIPPVLLSWLVSHLNPSPSPSLSLAQRLMSQKSLIMRFGHLPPPSSPLAKAWFPIKSPNCKVKKPISCTLLLINGWWTQSFIRSSSFGYLLTLQSWKTMTRCDVLFSFRFWWSESSHPFFVFLVYYFLFLPLSSSNTKWLSALVIGLMPLFAVHNSKHAICLSNYDSLRIIFK